MRILNKKGQVVANLQGFIMAVVTIAVVLAIGLYVLQTIQTNVNCSSGYYNTTSNKCEVSATNATVLGGTSAASNATGSVITQLGTAPTWIGLLIVVVFASAILAYF